MKVSNRQLDTAAPITESTRGPGYEQTYRFREATPYRLLGINKIQAMSVGQGGLGLNIKSKLWARQP